jgi:hypothetical protein
MTELRTPVDSPLYDAHAPRLGLRAQPRPEYALALAPEAYGAWLEL